MAGGTKPAIGCWRMKQSRRQPSQATAPSPGSFSHGLGIVHVDDPTKLRAPPPSPFIQGFIRTRSQKRWFEQTGTPVLSPGLKVATTVSTTSLTAPDRRSTQQLPYRYRRRGTGHRRRLYRRIPRSQSEELCQHHNLDPTSNLLPSQPTPEYEAVSSSVELFEHFEVSAVPFLAA